VREAIGAKMKRTMIILLGTMFVAGGLYAGGRNERTTTRTIGGGRNGRNEVTLEKLSLEMDKEIKINLRTGGSVQLDGWDAERIEIEITKWGNAIDDAVVEIGETRRGVSILTYYPESQEKASHAVDFKIKVPNRTNLFIETLGGDIILGGLEGEFEGRTLGGELNISRLKGTIDMETFGGSIEIRESVLDGEVRTLGGDINVFEVTGDLDTSTLGGRVVFHDSTAPSGSSPVKIDTMGGDIDIDEALSGIKATTLGGNISIAKAAVFVDADTLGGKIEIQDVDGWVRAKTLGGDVVVTMTGDPDDGKRDATLSSLGGDVTLTVPAGLDMDIEIILEVTSDAKRNYSITSDFDIEVEKRDVANRGGRNGERTMTTGRGTTGAGTHRITLSTINGNIYLREGK
jgi:DUF4097 and DUF4098 domain-containing protein YvlB